jgi:hypothetical protein
MSTIRPDLPAIQPQGVGSSSVRQAQAAFFRAALGEVQAAQTQALPVRTTMQPQTAAPAPSETGRMPRPGSLLDIKV